MNAKEQRQNGTHRVSLGYTIRSWWMVMAAASLGEDLVILAETGLTLPQVLTLYRLHDASPQCVSSIAAFLHLSQPATSQLLGRLVDEGLVDRSEDPGDRRRKRLALTTKGARLVTRLIDAKSRGLDHAANRLSPALRSRLACVLQEALAELEQAPEGAPCPPGRKERSRHENA